MSDDDDRNRGERAVTLRVLTLSSLFPDRTRPTFGVFVEKQTLGLAAHPDVELKVVSPYGVPPTPWLKRHPVYGKIAKLDRLESWKGLEVHRLPFRTVPLVGGRFNPWSMWWALVPLLDEIRQSFAFDVIDTEFFFPDGPAAARLAKRYDVPLSIKARGGDIHFWTESKACRRMIVEAGRAADGMLAVSGALRQDMIDLGMPGDRIKVHHTGVDQSAFRPIDRAAAKAALGVSGPLVVSVGYLIARKGQTLVVDAMRDVPGATYLIAGQGPDRAKLQAQIEAQGLSDRVRLIGPQAHEALPQLFGAADVMALPSASEGLANVWVEALACGSPIVISDIGGAREVVDRPAAGHIVDREPKAIAEAIRALLADPPVQAETAEAAKKFTWARNTEALYAHLSGLVAEYKS